MTGSFVNNVEVLWVLVHLVRCLCLPLVVSFWLLQSGYFRWILGSFGFGWASWLRCFLLRCHVGGEVDSCFADSLIWLNCLVVRLIDPGDEAFYLEIAETATQQHQIPFHGGLEGESDDR